MVLSILRIQIIFCLLFFSINCPVLSIPADKKAQQDNKTKSAKKPLDPMASFKAIQTPEGFPDLPVFNGHTKFVGGFYSPIQNGISVCQMRYFAQEDPQTVIDFYKDAFNGNGWKILQTAGTHLTARHRDGHMCSVNVNDCKLPKTKSQFTIAYREIVKQH